MKKLINVIAVLAILFVFLVPAAQAENTHSIDLEASNSEYLSIADSSQTGLDITGNMTIEIWVKLESQPENGEHYTIVGKWGSSTQSYFFAYKDANGTKEIRATTHDGNNAAGGTLPYTLNTGAWHHLAFAYNSSNSEVEIFVDTSSVGTIDVTSSIADSDANFEIGTIRNGDYLFDGKMDDARVWNDIRTPSEIANNYNIELTGSEANLVAYWKFNDSLMDASGYNNTLTNYGTSFSTDVPFTGSTETASCSCTGDNIDFAVATDLLGTGSQNMVLGTDSGGVPTVCVSQVGGSFLDEFTFFNDTWTPVSVTQIPGTNQITVIAYDAQGSYSEQILDTAAEEVVATNDL